MNVLIVYASRLGSTQAIAARLAERIRAHGLAATACSVETVDDFIPYDAVVVGSAVYGGHWLKEASRFVRRHDARLAARPVWLFSSGPVGKTATTHEPVESAEVGELARIVGARGHRTFAGSLDRSTLDKADLSTVERFVAKRFVPEGDFRDWPAIDAWADEIARALGATATVAV
jgi:menaquinone-dependent protoporphyrinogen oxidase